MKSTNLILHCGAAAVTREQVATVSTPAPTDTWHPIPHDALIGQVEKALATSNMRIVNESHALTKGGDRYFGLLQVANCNETEDYAYVLGLRNSHDKMFPAGLVVGSSVFVCDNLAFSGEIKIARKHTTHIMNDLPGLTVRAVGRLAERWNDMNTRIAAYKENELTDTEAHDLVIRMLDSRACTVTQIPGILNEWRNPRHPEFAEYRNCWRLFNATTENLKGSLNALPGRTQALHSLFDAHCGILSKTDSIRGGAVDVDVEVTPVNN